MSDITVGPIQTYAGDSLLSSPTVDQNSVQDSISITLTDSNLWLVDTSKLSGQTSNSQTQYTLLDLQTKYQTTVPFENVNFTAETIAPATSTTSESSYLQSDLSQGNALMLAEVTGGTQLSSSGISLSSSGSSGSASGTSSGGTSGGLSGGGDGGSGSSSGGSSGGSGGSGGSSGSSSGGSSGTDSSTGTVPNSSLSNSTPGTSSTDVSQQTSSPQPLISTPLTTGTQPPVPVPFEVSPTMGLLCVLMIFAYRFLLKKTPANSALSRVELIGDQQ